MILLMIQFLSQETRSTLISFLALYRDLFEPRDYEGWAACASASPNTFTSLVWEVLSVVVTTQVGNHSGKR